MRAFLSIATCSLMLMLGVGTAAAVPELCGNGLDDNTNGYADEGCWPAAVTGVCENPMSCKVTGDIAPKTGSLVYQVPQPDLNPTMPYGLGMPFRRTYMSQFNNSAQANYRQSMGTHWQHNYMSWLDKSGTTAVVHLVTGQDALFTFVNTSGGFDNYTPQAGLHVKSLKQSVSSPFNWELTTLTGETYVYNWTSPTGKLIEIRDSLPTPNKITISYNGGLISFVTDASNHKRYSFSYTGGQLTTLYYQTLNGGTPTTRMYVSFTYTGTDPVSMTYSGTTAQTMTYASGLLTAIIDASSKHIADFAWVAANPGQAARVTTGEGGIGYEYGSSNAQCMGGTVLFFNIANATTCTVDADCGGTNRCGGKTSAGATGKCYRAARCMQATSPSEDLITTVTAFTPCTGACAPTAEYAWNTATLDLKGVKRADNNWTSFQRDANGMVISMAEADTDSDATNVGGLKTFLWYDTNFPGRMTESRRRSDVTPPTNQCDAVNTAGCKRTLYTWSATTGLLDSKQEIGWTFDVTNTAVQYGAGGTYITSYLYDSLGRRTQVNGPLPGNDDVTDYTFWSTPTTF